jgi:hypothetical protein
MQRVPDNAVEPVETSHTVMHGMEPPENRPTVAQIVKHREGEVSDDEGEKELCQQRPLRWPNALKWKQPSDRWNEKDAVDGGDFVDDPVPDVGKFIAVRFIPLCVPGRDTLCGEGRGYGGQQNDG